MLDAGTILGLGCVGKLVYDMTFPAAKPRRVGHGVSLRAFMGRRMHRVRTDTSAAFAILADAGDAAARSGNLMLTQESLEDNLNRLGLRLYGRAEVARMWRRVVSIVADGCYRGVSEEMLDSAAKQCDIIAALLVQVREHLALTNFSIPEDYDYDAPTCSNYGVPVEEGFFGDFRRVRFAGDSPRARDYGYHNNYSRVRQLWQDNVIRLTVARRIPEKNPCIIFTCGAMGSGKGYTLEKMSELGQFPLEEMVRIDPDYFKTLMPEWGHYVAKGKDAGTLTHMESSYLQELCQEVALNRHQNIWVEGSLRDAEWFARVFRDIRERFPKYSIGIVHVQASEAVVRERIRAREASTGRGVPESLIQRSLEAPKESLHKLGMLADWVATVDNEDTPTLLSWSKGQDDGPGKMARSCLRWIHPGSGIMWKSSGVAPSCCVRLKLEAVHHK